MEQLIKQLNNQSNRPSPDEIREIERRVQNLQREFSGWRLGVDLLSNEDPLVRFYGALTLTIKINADWYVYILSYLFSIRPGHFLYTASSIAWIRMIHAQPFLTARADVVHRPLCFYLDLY
jgi:hypothetical protein